MGRNPFYMRHVKPILPRATVVPLGEVFDHFFRVGDVVFYEDDTQVAELERRLGVVRIRIPRSEHVPTPLLERSCSIYRKMEDHFPSKEDVYRVRRAIRHMFCNEHSLNRPFWYDVLELENEDDRYYTTFCIKTDGAILNIESLSLRGYATDAVVMPPVPVAKAPRRAG